MKKIFCILALVLSSSSYATRAGKPPIAIPIPDNAFGHIKALSHNGQLAVFESTDDGFSQTAETQYLVVNLATGRSEVFKRITGWTDSSVVFSADDRHMVHSLEPGMFEGENNGASIYDYVLDSSGHVLDSNLIISSPDVSKDYFDSANYELFADNTFFYKKGFSGDKKQKVVAYRLDTKTVTVVYEETAVEIGHFGVNMIERHKVNRSRYLFLAGWPGGGSSNQADLFLYSLDNGKMSPLGLADKNQEGELMTPLDFNHDSGLPWMTYDRGQGPNGLTRYVRNFVTGENIKVYQDPTGWILGTDWFSVNGDWLYFDDQRQLMKGLSMAFNTKTHERVEGLNHLSKSGRWALFRNNLGERLLDMQTGVTQIPYLPQNAVPKPVRLVTNLDDGYFILHSEFDEKSAFKLALWQVPLGAKRPDGKLLGSVEGVRGIYTDWGCEANSIRNSLLCHTTALNGKTRTLNVYEFPIL